MAEGRKTLFDVSMVIDKDESIIKIGTAIKVEYSRKMDTIVVHEPSDYETAEILPLKRTATGSITLPRLNGEWAKRVFPQDGSKPEPFNIIGTLKGTNDQVVKLVKCYVTDDTTGWSLDDYAKHDVSIAITRVVEY